MPDIFEFPEALGRAQTVAAVCAELMARVEPCGFTIYALGALPHPDVPYPSDFMITNWPPAWIAAYFDRQFGERDPTLRALATTGHAFTIAELRAGRLGFRPDARELEVLDFAGSLGFPEGIVVPVFRAHGHTGIACLTGPGPDPAPPIRARLQFLLEHTYDRLRALGPSQPQPRSGPVLSRREVEVLSLARRGLTDAAIAEAADISVRTVRFHFENARRKLAAHSRSEAVAIAVGRYLLPV